MNKYKKFVKTLGEMIGRFSIILLAAVAINRTEWYQSFNQQMPLTEPFGWLIAIGIIGSIMWMFLPIFAFYTEEGEDNG